MTRMQRVLGRVHNQRRQLQVAASVGRWIQLESKGKRLPLWAVVKDVREVIKGDTDPSTSFRIRAESHLGKFWFTVPTLRTYEHPPEDIPPTGCTDWKQ